MTKRAKRKKKPQQPPLSLPDKLVYGLLWVSAVILILGLTYLFISIREYIFLQDPNLVAYEDASTGLLVLPLLLFLFIFVVAQAEAKRPLFPNKKIHYGEAPWNDVYPLFLKGRPRRKLNPYKRKARRTGVLMVLGLFVFTLVLAGFSFYGHHQLNENGTVAVYGTVNQLKKVYTPADVEKLTIRTYHKTHVRSLGTWTFCITVKMDDTRKYSFDYGHFRSLEEMLAYRALIPGDKIVVYGADDLDRVIAVYDLTKADRAELYALFQAP